MAITNSSYWFTGAVRDPAAQKVSSAGKTRVTTIGNKSLTSSAEITGMFCVEV